MLKTNRPSENRFRMSPTQIPALHLPRQRKSNSDGVPRARVQEDVRARRVNRGFAVFSLIWSRVELEGDGGILRNDVAEDLAWGYGSFGGTVEGRRSTEVGDGGS